jgi:hypothetical protein
VEAVVKRGWFRSFQKGLLERKQFFWVAGLGTKTWRLFPYAIFNKVPGSQKSGYCAFVAITINWLESPPDSRAPNH